MGPADLAGDHQPQAGATTGAGAALVQTHEPLKDPFALGLRDARPIVFDLDFDSPAEDLQPEIDVALGMPYGVVGQVAQRSGQLDGVTLDAHWRRCDCDGDLSELSESVRLVV